MTWTFRTVVGRTEWDWGQGPPVVRHLHPFRRPGSGAASRHIPVRAYCETVGAYIDLESGLEHDLLRVLDRDPSVRWIVAQPFELGWQPAGRRARRRHTPDLLSLDHEDRVTAWDVKRAETATSGRFAEDREITAAACRQRGWRYEVFTGVARVHRHNLLWLQAYRRRPPWAERYEPALVVEATGGALLGELLLGSDDPLRTSVMWHLIWTGRLIVDLTARLSTDTEVTA